jgi:hypothetical protein
LCNSYVVRRYTYQFCVVMSFYINYKVMGFNLKTHYFIINIEVKTHHFIINIEVKTHYFIINIEVKTHHFIINNNYHPCDGHPINPSIIFHKLISCANLFVLRFPKTYLRLGHGFTGQFVILVCAFLLQ